MPRPRIADTAVRTAERVGSSGLIVVVSATGVPPSRRDLVCGSRTPRGITFQCSAWVSLLSVSPRARSMINLSAVLCSVQQ